MALFTSFFFVPVTPAKTPTSNAIFPRLSSSSSSSFGVKPIFTNNFTFITTRASLTQKYVYPDPCPHFAESETQKFKAELLEKLLEEKDEFGDELDAVINVCAQNASGHLSPALPVGCFVIAVIYNWRSIYDLVSFLIAP
ncbi:hypothetical protein TanjilG_15912 [Lupinus angustifolius]|uniref:Uncharacterized protein n=1 Tax=Lupinus angustifolius TaxID=3871 RepID=A0A4P1RGF4_LUPAN|nr:hypothetical protein TanjilG_15912 [Lupinus angustifolius]